MLPAAVAALRCPHDATAFTLAGRSLRCVDGHAFDLARQGYVNLLTGADPGTGDDAAMVAARAEILDDGRFAPLTRALADTVAELAPAATAAADGVVVVDLGAGTGHHLAGVLDALPGATGVAIDLSKYAARRAARCHPRAAAVVADVWRQLPIATGGVAGVTCIFAPRNAREIRRILRPDGVLIVATPTPRHLRELVDPLGLVTVDERKMQRLAASFGPDFRSAGEVRPVEGGWSLSHHDAATIIAMGPSADHLDVSSLGRRLAALPEPVAATCSVELRVYRPR